MWTRTKDYSYRSNAIFCVCHKGPLASFKLHAGVYGDAKDNNLDGIQQHILNLYYLVNLYDLILKQFISKGRCVIMDSVYMSYIMTQIGRFKFSMNMAGVAKVNLTGANTKVLLIP